MFLQYICTLRGIRKSLSLYSWGLPSCSLASGVFSWFSLESWGFLLWVLVPPPSTVIQSCPIGGPLGWSSKGKRKVHLEDAPPTLHSALAPFSSSLGQMDRFSLRLLSVLPLRYSSVTWAGFRAEGEKKGTGNYLPTPAHRHFPAGQMPLLLQQERGGFSWSFCCVCLKHNSVTLPTSCQSGK